MYNFILQLIVMLSLGAIIYLIARAAPRVTEAESSLSKENYFDKLMQKLPLEKADAFVSAYLEWFLRKLKIVILRLENIVEKHFRKLKPVEVSGVIEKPSIFSAEGGSAPGGEEHKKSDNSGGVENKGNLSDIK